jgi:hypothetical protein
MNGLSQVTDYYCCVDIIALENVILCNKKLPIQQLLRTIGGITIVRNQEHLELLCACVCVRERETGNGILRGSRNTKAA